MLIVCKDTIMNPAILETRSLPKKFFGRVQVLPKRAGLGLWCRLVLEMQLVRYLSALLPFAAIPLFSRDLALPITQAPVAMVVVIAIVELKVLRLSDAARERFMEEDEALRRLDLFDLRAKTLLRRLAAKRGIENGELSLVCEQSELARVRPLTFVTVQSSDPSPNVVDLNEEERGLFDGLFDDDLTEKSLYKAHLRLEQNIRVVKIEAQGISAHARLAAVLENQAVGR